jgi:hypothetical protein
MLQCYMGNTKNKAPLSHLRGIQCCHPLSLEISYEKIKKKQGVIKLRFIL